MYSLVNIAALVRDLSRHARSDAVAADLLRAFSLDAPALAALDAVRPDANAAVVRARLLTADAARPRALQLLAAARADAADLGLDAYTAAVDRLECTPMGDLEGVVRFLRDEVLSAAWRGDEGLWVATVAHALDVVTDGVIASYAGDDNVGAQWRRWVAETECAVAPTPWPDIVAAVAGVPAHSQWPVVPATWAVSMHDACWAVHLTGRERVAAITQLHALRALLAVSAPELPPLRAVSATVAAVHAHVVADLIDSATHEAMTQPLFRLLA
jgi:hypothetical protein